MEENLITPTQNIVFAALKDGSFIANFKEGGKASPENISKVFDAMEKMVQKLDKDELFTFALLHLFETRRITDCITKRMKQMEVED